MKFINILLFLIIVSCKDGRIVEKPLIKKSLSLTSKSDSINTESEEDLCNFTAFLNDPKVPKIAKELLNRKCILKEEELLDLLEKLKSKNIKERFFYCKIITNSYDFADGGFAEALGYEGKEFVDNNTKEFISYFDHEACFETSDLRKWSKIIIMEIAIDSEEQNPKVVEDYNKFLDDNCLNCTQNQHRNLNLLKDYLKIDWKEYLNQNK